MSLWDRSSRAATARRPRNFSPSTRPLVESLESRLVLSAATAVAPAAQVAHLAAKPTIQSLVTLTGLTVNNITQQGDTLLAHATATLNIAGRTITQAVDIPLSLGLAPDQTGATDCPILNLSVGPVHLDVLGLNVDLDNCDGGPITVAITAQPGDGNLLGNLLCDVSHLLDGGTSLGDILGGLTGDNLGQLTTGLTDALNNILGTLLGSAGGAAGAAQTAAAPAANTAGQTDILNLHLNEIHLDLLGLKVDTSSICLDVYAQEGPGNLLGNLLGSLSDLLNNSGNNGHAQTVLLRNINRVLDQLGL